MSDREWGERFVATIVVGALLFVIGWNQRAKNFGGEMTIELPCGMKLTEITWKDDDMWYAVRPFRKGEFAETYTFIEDASFGLMEGTVTLIECVVL